MAFRKKAAAILEHQPDILVIPECEHPGNLLFANGIQKPAHALWFGNNRHKGLGIFSYGNFKLQALDCHNPQLRTIVPILVTGKRIQFTLYAIWAYNPDDRDGCYVTQVWKAIHHYDHMLSNKKTLLIGDFNSNTIWDKPKREGNHSTVVERLKKKGIHSVYHKHFKQKQGKEEHPTFYLYKHQDKPYHLDYCFASSDLIRKLERVEVGDHATWSPYSDHVPVIATFNVGNAQAHRVWGNGK
jgi:exonuclease III